MKVLLVSHSFETNLRSYSATDCNTPYSLGLAYLSSSLKTRGHQTEVLWLDSYSFAVAHKRIMNSISKMSPDILVIQMFTMNRVSSYLLIEECSLKYPYIHILVGGIHASAMYEQLIKKFKNIIIGIGEGEYTLPEIVNALEKDSSGLSKIKGIVYWKNGAMRMTPPRELNYNLDELPYPDQEVFFEAEPNRTLACVTTSRGCPFNCSFCCLPIISHGAYRERDIDEVVKEIVDLKRKYPRLKTIQFSDDNFTMKNERVIDFCKKIIPYSLKLAFEASARIKPVSEEMLYYMEKAGFRKIMFGLETGSKKMLDSIHKAITQEDAIALFHKLKKRKLIVTTLLLIGFPGENEDTINETINFVKKLQKIRYNYITMVGKLCIYPKTEICQIAKNRGKFSDDFWASDEPVPYFTIENDLSTLKRWENKILDNCSIARILTIKGFINHFLSMPGVIIKYLITNKSVARSVISETINAYLLWLNYEAGCWKGRLFKHANSKPVFQRKKI